MLEETICSVSKISFIRLKNTMSLFIGTFLSTRKKLRRRNNRTPSSSSTRHEEGQEGGEGGREPATRARDKNSRQAAIKRMEPRQLIAAAGNNRPRERRAIIFTTSMILSIYLAKLGARCGAARRGGTRRGASPSLSPSPR